jgi:phosphoribosylanthranilate isomerase
MGASAEARDPPPWRGARTARSGRGRRAQSFAAGQLDHAKRTSLREESVQIARSYERLADYLLLDSHRPSDRQIGALGVPHDWSVSRRIVEQVSTSVILAGGLGPDNVAQSINIVRPAGVDSKTKTDREGSHTKDLERVRRFYEAAHAAVSRLDRGS